MNNWKWMIVALVSIFPDSIWAEKVFSEDNLQYHMLGEVAQFRDKIVLGPSKAGDFLMIDAEFQEFLIPCHPSMGMIRQIIAFDGKLLVTESNSDSIWYFDDKTWKVLFNPEEHFGIAKDEHVYGLWNLQVVNEQLFFLCFDYSKDPTHVSLIGIEQIGSTPRIIYEMEKTHPSLVNLESRLVLVEPLLRYIAYYESGEMVVQKPNVIPPNTEIPGFSNLISRARGIGKWLVLRAFTTIPSYPTVDWITDDLENLYPLEFDREKMGKPTQYFTDDAGNLEIVTTDRFLGWYVLRIYKVIDRELTLISTNRMKAWGYVRDFQLNGKDYLIRDKTIYEYNSEKIRKVKKLSGKPEVIQIVHP